MGSKGLTRPPRLRVGARIALVAPAGPLLERDDLTRGAELCRALGFEPVLAPNAGNRYGYLAGSDEQRLDDLNTAVRDSAIDGIWCLRGGYGITRILSGVDFAALERRPKAVIGFSDITALINAIAHRSGVVAFHGPMSRKGLTPFSRSHFERILTSPLKAGTLGRPAQPEGVLVSEVNRIVTLAPGKVEGRLYGGNLTLLQALIGTEFLPLLDGAILFLEDVGEDLYSVDRMLAHLRMAGVLGRVKGVMVGQFTDMKRNTSDGALGFDEVLATYFLPLRIPVAYGLPIGHVDDQWTLPLGVEASFDATTGEVQILEGAVE
ncbi:MAG: LD-carboxypeptidase [Gemmatimonadota bacterium]